MTIRLDYAFKPLLSWPGKRTEKPRRAPFKATYDTTLRDLDRELRHLGATGAIFQADCSEDDIRIDGRLRAEARLRTQGIILTFDCKLGTLSYPCDTYDQWPMNLRAIVLFMENQRANTRYGVGTTAQHYAGFRQLPGGTGPSIAVAEWASVEAAARWLMERADWDWAANPVRLAAVIADPRPCWIEASKRHHPDASGMDALMAKVNRCRDFIVAHNQGAVA